MVRATILVVILFTAVAQSASTTTIYVPDDQPTIIDAINAAVDGDVIIVRPGTYVENIDYKGKSISIESEMGPYLTTIDGAQRTWVVEINNGEGPGTVLEGFTVRNGGYMAIGCGVYCSGGAIPIIRGNIITGNRDTDRGAGIFCRNSAAPHIINNVISGNRAKDYGGGIACDKASPLIENNLITGNEGDWMGGGIYLDESSPTIRGNIISGNYCDPRSWAGCGGGILCYIDSSPLIENNLIVGNWVTGDDTYYADTAVGGGIAAFSASGYPTSDLTLVNNTIVGNSATGYLPTVGGGLEIGGNASATIVNCIVRGNFADTGPSLYVGPNQTVVDIAYSNFEGGQTGIHVEPGGVLNWGAGNIDAVALFADPSSTDYHLAFDSPCRDVGDNGSVTELLDFEGDPRIADGTVDMGADEFHHHLYQLGAVVPGNPLTLKVIGTPGVPATLALGAGIQDPPQSTQYGILWLQFPLQRFQLGLIPSEGILLYQTTVPTYWHAGDEKPLQALVGPRGNPASVLTNLHVLYVE